jgi:hypothetical protein
MCNSVNGWVSPNNQKSFQGQIDLFPVADADDGYG